jgi:hypothetical protein
MPLFTNKVPDHRPNPGKFDHKAFMLSDYYAIVHIYQKAEIDLSRNV